MRNRAGVVKMKKLISLTLVLLLTLTACGGSGVSDILGGKSPDGEDGSDIYAEDGFAEGRIGDVIHSAFMNFSVNSAYTAAGYNGHTAPEGKQVLVVEMTIKNTFKESLPMWDDDFQAQWTASDETGEFAYPITDGNDNNLGVVAEEQLPAEYELAINETRTGTLVFDVPAGEKDFSVSHMELFNDGTEGDTFFVYFTAEVK